VALLHSNDMTPTELYIVDSEGGSTERRITTSPPTEFAQYNWVEPRYVTFKSHLDGVTLHGRLLEPPNLDRSKKHPVILGPVYPNSVRKRWGDKQIFRGLYSLIQQYFVLEGGYIVFQVDTRGSVGYGRPFREALIRDYGGIDIEDLYSGLEYLKTLPYVDADRVGMWGSSYGGLMTAMSLFKKPGVYKAGVASAPATNVWHAMTGQVNVAGRPNTHPDVYKKVSAYSYGEDLEDHLMIIHGMGDSVVLFKDSIALAEKLMKLGKDFEFVVIPNSPHEWTAKDYNARYGMTRLAEHFDRYLK
jgi:dipeptidyl-peptidase-4